jgi:hypothetical protein
MSITAIELAPAAYAAGTSSIAVEDAEAFLARQTTFPARRAGRGTIRQTFAIKPTLSADSGSNEVRR